MKDWLAAEQEAFAQEIARLTAELERVRALAREIVDIINCKQGVGYNYTEASLLEGLTEIEDLAVNIYAPEKTP